MPGFFNRTLDRWADDNVAGRGKNAIRFVVFMLGAGACIVLGVLVSQSPSVKAAIGERLTALLALVVILPSLALLAMGMMCILMSLLNASRTGKLG